MKKIFLKISFVLFLALFLSFPNILKVLGQTSNSIEINSAKDIYLPGENLCIHATNLPGVQSGSYANIKLYLNGPNSECSNGCDKTVLFLYTPFFQGADVCMIPKDENVGSWSAYIEYNGIRSNTINYQIKNREQVINESFNNTSTLKVPVDFKVNGLKNITTYTGNIVRFTYWTGKTGSDDLTLDSWYTADGPDTCPGGITAAGQIKPWVVKRDYASDTIEDTIKQCQEGRTYTITLALRDSKGNIVGADSVVVSVRSPNDRSNQSFCNFIEANKTYTFSEIKNIIRPFFESEYLSCSSQIDNSTYPPKPKNVNYYIPSGDPSTVPIGNSYFADFRQIINGQQIIVPKGIMLCSYSNPYLSAFASVPMSLSGSFCFNYGGLNFSWTDYCLEYPSGEIIANQIKSSCGKTINVVPDSESTSTSSITGTGIFANGQKNITVFVGDTINYTWLGPEGNGYTYSSFYTADAPDNCPGGITSASQAKPWIANTRQGSKSDQIQQCQAGRTYTISYLVYNSAGNVVYKDSIAVGVFSGQRPNSQISQTSTQNQVSIPTTNQYKPLDVSLYTGPTTFAGLENFRSTSSQSQSIPTLNQPQSNSNNVINSLSDIISKINSILGSAKNLSQEDQDIISKAMQTILNAVQNLIESLASKNSQNQSQISVSSSAQKISTVTSGAKISVAVKPATTTFRYIKDDISKSGWVAIREMKFYDANNNEIKPVNANASCDWCGYGTPPSYSVGPKGIFDGNWETVWNAGETATDCNWYISHMRDDGIYGVGCSSSKIRTAWINVDLGAPVSLSKIKIHIMGDSNNRLDSLSGSIDGKNYVDLCKIQASKDKPLVDLGPTGDWIECNLEK